MTHIEWQFGGWLRDWPVSLVAAVLAAAALVGLIGILWSYRRARGELSLSVRLLLAGLRATALFLILLCLANPVRLEKAAAPKNPQRSLAVLVDRSASMSEPDYRGQTRLAVALRSWHQLEPQAARHFGKISYFRFGNEIAPAHNLDDAASTGTRGSETHLFGALRTALDKNPTAVVCLTDGLDTSADDAGKFAAEAASHGVPIYFVPGENHQVSGASLALREIKAPATVLRKTEFTATALIESTSAQDRDVPLELWVDGQKQASTRLPVRAGRNTLSWPVTVDSGEPGRRQLEFRAADQSVSSTTEVIENRAIEVLYYQGALQWGYRFLRGALETDPSFRLTAILNPALGVQITAAGDTRALTDLPDDAAALKRYQVVVLAHVFASQLSPAQQQALVEYVRGGGSVLFISPDTTATEQFSGSALEQMLPVVFANGGADDAAVRQMQSQLSANATTEGNDFFAGGDQAIPLKPFAQPTTGPRLAGSELFAGTNWDLLPKFAASAKVLGVKPGAETLAVNGLNPAAVLLARQQFGQGRAAVLATDLLWRWKLSLPSTSRAVERFWQQFLLSLAPRDAGSLVLTRLTPSPAMNAPLIFAINKAVAADTVRLDGVSPTGHHQELAVAEVAEADGPMLQGSFTPDVKGRWQFTATDSAGRVATAAFTVGEKSASAELSHLPADLAGMRQLAESTGGGLVDGNTRFELALDVPPKPAEKLPEPLWNSGLLLVGLLGLYAAELILRRRYKML